MKRNWKTAFLTALAFGGSQAFQAADAHTYTCRATLPYEEGRTRETIKVEERSKTFELVIPDDDSPRAGVLTTNVGQISVHFDAKEDLIEVGLRASTGDGAATMYRTRIAPGTRRFLLNFEVMNLVSDKRAEGELDCSSKDR
jgi:hypothetical protein